MAKGAKITVEQLDRSPSHLLHRALQLALDVYADETGPGAITQRQYAVLAAVAANEGLTQTDLVRATGIDRSTLADMIARMIAKDLLARERSVTDGRANTVRLTDSGRTTLEEAAPRVQAADARILSYLPGAKRDSFIGHLSELARAGELIMLGEAKGAAADLDGAKPKNAKKDKKAKDADKPKKGKKAKGKKADRADKASREAAEA